MAALRVHTGRTASPDEPVYLDIDIPAGMVLDHLTLVPYQVMRLALVPPPALLVCAWWCVGACACYAQTWGPGRSFFNLLSTHTHAGAHNGRDAPSSAR